MRMKIRGENVLFERRRRSKPTCCVNLSGKKTLIGRNSGKYLHNAGHPWGNFAGKLEISYLVRKTLRSHDRDMSRFKGMFLSFFVL
jgi:hypothetical protein